MVTYAFQVDRPNVDPGLWHPIMAPRWAQLQPRLESILGVRCEVNVGYRPDARQRWLYGQGRSTAQLKAVGLDPTLARPGLIVTNAYSAKTSAHGFVLHQCTEEWPDGIPASCALDIVVYDLAGKLWADDTPWDQFVALTSDGGPLVGLGLRHFFSKGKQVTDRPHLQAVEWSDHTHNLLV